MVKPESILRHGTRSGGKARAPSSSAKKVTIAVHNNEDDHNNQDTSTTGSVMDTGSPMMKGDLFETPNDFSSLLNSSNFPRRRGHQPDTLSMMNQFQNDVPESPMFGVQSPPIVADNLIPTDNLNLAVMAAAEKDNPSPDADNSHSHSPHDLLPAESNGASDGVAHVPAVGVEEAKMAVQDAAKVALEAKLSSSSEEEEEEDGSAYDSEATESEHEDEQDDDGKPAANATPHQPAKASQQHTIGKITSVGTHARENHLEMSPIDQPQFDSEPISLSKPPTHVDGSDELDGVFVQALQDDDDDDDDNALNRKPAAVAEPVATDPASQADAIVGASAAQDDPPTKKKRGRKPKKSDGSSNKENDNKQKQAAEPTVVKKKRGRPKGSKNKATITKANATKAKQPKKASAAAKFSPSKMVAIEKFKTQNKQGQLVKGPKKARKSNAKTKKGGDNEASADNQHVDEPNEENDMADDNVVIASEKTKPAKRRGRPPKKKVVEEDGTTGVDGVGDTAESGVEQPPPKRKRGRPPKKKKEEETDTSAVHTSTSSDVTQQNSKNDVPKKKRGRPRKDETKRHSDDANADATAQKSKDDAPKKKRGRPRKNPDKSESEAPATKKKRSSSGTYKELAKEKDGKANNEESKVVPASAADLSMTKEDSTPMDFMMRSESMSSGKLKTPASTTTPKDGAQEMLAAPIPVADFFSPTVTVAAKGKAVEAALRLLPGNSGESPTIKPTSQSVSSCAGPTSAVSEEEKGEQPITIVDEHPRRLVNPLIDFNVAISEDKESSADTTNLIHGLDIDYAKPDTFPIAFVARTLGFDVPMLDVDAQELPATDSQHFTIRKDESIHSVPPLGSAFRMWETQRYGTGRNARGDFMDPLYKTLLNEEWNDLLQREDAAFGFTRVPSNDASQVSKRCVESFKEHGVIGPDCKDFDGVIPRKQQGRSLKWVFHKSREVYYRFWEQQLDSEAPDGIFIYDNAVNRDSFLKLMEDPNNETKLLLLTYAIMLDHARECEAKYACVVAHRSMVEMLCTLFRMELVEGELPRLVASTHEAPKHQARLVCDLSKCSTAYACLIIRKKYRDSRLPSPSKKERMLVAVSRRPSCRDDGDQRRAFAAATGNASEASRQLRLDLSHGDSSFHFVGAAGETEACVADSTADGAEKEVSWNLLRSFPVQISQATTESHTLENPSEPSEEEDEILRLLRRKQHELAEIEHSLEPVCHKLFRNLVAERKEYERRETEKGDENRQVIELYRRRFNGQAAAAAHKQVNVDMDAACMLCGDGAVTHKNKIVFCDACNLAVHQDCYGIEVVPEKKWFCSLCKAKRSGARHPDSGNPSCAFCPCSAGRTLGGFHQLCTSGPTKRSSLTWVHAVCAKYQGLHLVDDQETGSAVYIDDADLVTQHKKLDIVCCLCEHSGGAFKRCAVPGCRNHCHIGCARASKQCTMIHGELGCGSIVQEAWTLKCPEHSEVDAEDRGVPLEDLVHQAQEFASSSPANVSVEELDNQAQPRPFDPNSFGCKSREEQQRLLSHSDGEKAFFEEMRDHLEGARCDVCDGDYSYPNLQRCLSCHARLCVVCTESSESNHLQSDGFRCGGCLSMVAQACSPGKHRKPQCSVCFWKGGWLRRATASQRLLSAKSKKSLQNPSVFQASLFAQELWCHTLCCRAFIDDPDEHDVDGAVDITWKIKGNGQFIKPNAVCTLCGNSGGLIADCKHYKDCKHRFHATCARQAGFTVAPEKLYDKKFEVYCFKHSESENNLRAKIEDTLDTEDTRLRANGLESPLTNSCASKILHSSIEILRVLGWAWRWEEWWIKKNYSWEPLIPSYLKEQGLQEKDLSNEQKRILFTSPRDRKADADRCSLGSFGAALRNRSYDTPNGFDNESLERALRAVLNTPSIVGPLHKDQYDELEFLVEWLARAYRSKSPLLGFGDDKIECGDAKFLYAKSGKGKSPQTPKFELGSREVPGRRKPFESFLLRAQKTGQTPARRSLERKAKSFSNGGSPENASPQNENEMRGDDPQPSKRHYGDTPTPLAKASETDISSNTGNRLVPKPVSGLKPHSTPARLSEKTEQHEAAAATAPGNLAVQEVTQPEHKKPTPQGTPKEGQHDDGATTETEASVQLGEELPAVGKTKVVVPQPNGGKQIPRRRPGATNPDAPKSKVRGLPVRKRALEETDGNVAKRRASETAKPSHGQEEEEDTCRQQDGDLAPVLEEDKKISGSVPSQQRAQLDAGAALDANESDEENEEEEDVNEGDDSEASDDHSMESFKTHNTVRSRRSFAGLNVKLKAKAKPPVRPLNPSSRSGAISAINGLGAGVKRDSSPRQAGLKLGSPEMNNPASRRVTGQPTAASRSMSSRRFVNPERVQSPAAASRGSLRPKKQQPMANLNLEEEDDEQENVVLKLGVKGNSIVADEQDDGEDETALSDDDGATFTGRHVGGRDADAVSVLTALTNFPTTPLKPPPIQMTLQEAVEEANFRHFNGLDVPPNAIASSTTHRDNHQVVTLTKRQMPVRRPCILCGDEKKKLVRSGCNECFIRCFEVEFQLEVDRDNLDDFFNNKYIPLCTGCGRGFHNMISRSASAAALNEG